MDRNTDFNKICGARIKKEARQCTHAALQNGRCRYHGGLSTGAKTVAGVEAIRNAQFKHGRRSKAFLEYRQQLCAFLRQVGFYQSDI